jgi:DNA polymerase III sliding clamp (beta) subunit (PCNA family)
LGVCGDDAFDGASAGENAVRHDSKQALDGALPDLQTHIPTVFTTEILVQRQIFLDAIKRLELYGEEESSPTSKVELVVSDNEFSVHAIGDPRTV